MLDLTSMDACPDSHNAFKFDVAQWLRIVLILAAQVIADNEHASMMFDNLSACL